MYFEEQIDTSKINYSNPLSYYPTKESLEIFNDKIRLYMRINNYDADDDLGGAVYKFKYTENGKQYNTDFCIQINQDDFCESWLS